MKNVKTLIDLRAEWIKERDKFEQDSQEFIRLHFGIYALDEAIDSLEAGKVRRYKDKNISLDSMLRRKSFRQE
jgi:hypothetical protein